MPPNSGNFVDVKNGRLCEPWYVGIAEEKFQQTENLSISHSIIVAKRYARRHFPANQLHTLCPGKNNHPAATKKHARARRDTYKLSWSFSAGENHCHLPVKTTTI
jgi:hypothetical protein